MPTPETYPFNVVTTPELTDATPYVRRVLSVSERLHDLETEPVDPREISVGTGALRFMVLNQPELAAYGPMH